MLIIDPRSNVPPYEQVRSQLVVQITRGELAPGTQLPTVRRLASDLGLAANTVARAYRELETAGFVRTAGRNGTVVLPPNDGPDVTQQALGLAEAYVQAMRSLGLGPDAMMTYVRRAAAPSRTSADLPVEAKMTSGGRNVGPDSNPKRS